jgi:hypothetical protein
MRGLRCRLCQWRKNSLGVGLNWTEVKQFHTLMASAVITGRTSPLLWESYPGWKLRNGQNALEEGLMLEAGAGLTSGVAGGNKKGIRPVNRGVAQFG